MSYLCRLKRGAVLTFWLSPAKFIGIWLTRKYISRPMDVR